MPDWAYQGGATYGVNMMTHTRGSVEWQRIDTAPADHPVRLGRYVDSYNDGVIWRTSVGPAWVTKGRWFFRHKVRPAYNDEYTHWKPLPPAPSAAPDLLEALERLLKLHQSQDRETTPEEIAAEYAIAKAKGGVE